MAVTALVLSRSISTSVRCNSALVSAGSDVALATLLSTDSFLEWTTRMRPGGPTHEVRLDGPGHDMKPTLAQWRID